MRRSGDVVVGENCDISGFAEGRRTATGQNENEEDEKDLK